MASIDKARSRQRYSFPATVVSTFLKFYALDQFYDDVWTVQTLPSEEFLFMKERKIIMELSA